MDARLRFDFDSSLPCPSPFAHSDRLVRTHLKLVERIARKLFRDMSAAIAIDDLVQIGNVALIEAARTFVDRGTAQFQTYAAMRVRGAMIDELRRIATISRGAMSRRRDHIRAERQLSLSLGRAPNDGEMADHLNRSVSAYQADVADMQPIEQTSIDESYSDTNGWFADPAAGADELLVDKRRAEAMAAAMCTLSDRHQQVLRMYFLEDMSLHDIGERLGASDSRICQIKRTALQRLRGALKGW